MQSKDDHPIIFFDGVCNFCNGWVNFIIRFDKKSIFRFAPLQSPLAAEFLSRFPQQSRYDSLILLWKGKIYSRSSAALIIFNELGWYWKWTQLFRMVPVAWRDAVYNRIAKNRYKWFGKRDSCMVLSDAVRARFLG